MSDPAAGRIMDFADQPRGGTGGATPGVLTAGAGVGVPGSATEALIRLERVTKVYRRGSREIPVLEDVTFAVTPGDFVALVGPSGSGKTTLLNLIAGIDQPTAGRVTVGGVEVSALSEGELAAYRARHVGYVFQVYNLIPVLTAFENVELPLLLTPLSKCERREHVARALDLVGLADRADHFPGQLSGGEEQRVAIARAIVTDPTVILADEPTGDLDARSAEEVLTLLSRLHAGFRKTIIMVTHDPRAASRASTAHRLEKGRLDPEAGRAGPMRGAMEAGS